MKNEIKSCWLWPDHVIGGHESRQLREEHNALANDHAALLAERDRLRAALKMCVEYFESVTEREIEPSSEAYLQARTALAEGGKV